MEVDKIFMPLGVWLIPIDTLGIPMNLDLLGWSDDLALSFAPLQPNNSRWVESPVSISSFTPFIPK